jgi:hypothetical protein
VVAMNPNFGINFERKYGKQSLPPSRRSARSFRFRSLKAVGLFLQRRPFESAAKKWICSYVACVESWYELGNNSRTSHMAVNKRFDQVSVHNYYGVPLHF